MEFGFSRKIGVDTVENESRKNPDEEIIQMSALVIGPPGSAGVGRAKPLFRGGIEKSTQFL